MTTLLGANLRTVVGAARVAHGSVKINGITWLAEGIQVSYSRRIQDKLLPHRYLLRYKSRPEGTLQIHRIYRKDIDALESEINIDEYEPVILDFETSASNFTSTGSDSFIDTGGSWALHHPEIEQMNVLKEAVNELAATGVTIRFIGLSPNDET